MSARTEAWPRPHRLTVDDYYRMAQAGVLSPNDRVELIEGEIIDMARIGSSHAAAVDLLAVPDLVNRALRRLLEPSAGRYEVDGSVKTGRVRFDPLNVEAEIDDLF
jgi:hypothetical protein